MKVEIKLKNQKGIKKPLYTNPIKISITNKMVDFENEYESGYLLYSDFDEIIITEEKK